MGLRAGTGVETHRIGRTVATFHELKKMGPNIVPSIMLHRRGNVLPKTNGNGIDHQVDRHLGLMRMDPTLSPSFMMRQHSGQDSSRKPEAKREKAEK